MHVNALDLLELPGLTEVFNGSSQERVGQGLNAPASRSDLIW
jgi:hypothetical protein